VFQQIQTHTDFEENSSGADVGRKEEVIEKIPEPFEYFEFILSL